MRPRMMFVDKEACRLGSGQVYVDLLSFKIAVNPLFRQICGAHWMCLFIFTHSAKLMFIYIY